QRRGSPRGTTTTAAPLNRRLPSLIHTRPSPLGGPPSGSPSSSWSRSRWWPAPTFFCMSRALSGAVVCRRGWLRGSRCLDRGPVSATVGRALNTSAHRRVAHGRIAEDDVRRDRCGLGVVGRIRVPAGAAVGGLHR